MVAALLCAATSWSSAALAAIETVVALPSLRAAAGAEVAVEVFHTNSAAEAEALSILDQVECLLETNGGSVSGALTRGGPAEREPIALAAGGFRKDVYTLRLPEGVSGVVTIELVGIAANAVMLQVGIAEQTDTSRTTGATRTSSWHWRNTTEPSCARSSAWAPRARAPCSSTSTTR
jgi:hypothetical protein